MAVIRQLKRTDGMTVRALARALRMSYMGVKKPCLDLAKSGYLTGMRKPGVIGRPELVYRLTEKGHEIFPAESNELTLEILSAARELFGPAAPGKLLYVYFREKEKRYASRIRGDEPRQRALWLTRERDKEGFLATVEDGDDLTGFQICERHNPLADILAAFPEATRMESDMIERLVGAPTRAAISPNSSRYQRVYAVSPTVVSNR